MKRCVFADLFPGMLADGEIAFTRDSFASVFRFRLVVIFGQRSVVGIYMAVIRELCELVSDAI